MKELICIGCPNGCLLQVDEEKDFKVTGNKCLIGERYGKEELINPVRTLTSTVRISHAIHPLLPVRTDKAIPKSLLLKAMEEINLIQVNAPVKMGDIVLENIFDTGANVIASRSMEEVK